MQANDKTTRPRLLRAVGDTHRPALDESAVTAWARARVYPRRNDSTPVCRPIWHSQSQGPPRRDDPTNAQSI